MGMKTYKLIDGPDDGSEATFEEPLYLGEIIGCPFRNNLDGSWDYFLYEVISDDTMKFYKYDTVA